MIKIEHIRTFGFEGALRGMRNPLDSWKMADSTFNDDGDIEVLGPNDESLIKRLTRAGGSHRKFLRMMHVQMDVTAPLYWWKDYDTYKVATVANSCSTMHKIHQYEFTMDMFSTEHLDKVGVNLLDQIIRYLNYYRDVFIKSGRKDKDAWWNMIQMLPTSYMQKRTLDLNYETILAILHDREFHKQDEFRILCATLKRELPLMEMIFEAAFGKGEVKNSSGDVSGAELASKEYANPIHEVRNGNGDVVFTFKANEADNNVEELYTRAFSKRIRNFRVRYIVKSTREELCSTVTIVEDRSRPIDEQLRYEICRTLGYPSVDYILITHFLILDNK